MTRSLLSALVVAWSLSGVSLGCQRMNGGHVVVAMGMSVDEIERASTDLGRWLRERRDVVTKDGFRISGEVGSVRIRHPKTGSDVALGPSDVWLHVDGDSLTHVSINPQSNERCGADYAQVVARLLAGGFATDDGRPFDVHLEERYQFWRPYWAEERWGTDRDLTVQLNRDDALLDVRFLVDPSGELPTKSARDACFVGVWLWRP